MKKIIAMLFVFMLLFSCAKEKTVTGVVNNEELPVNITEASIAESNVSQQQPTEIKRELETFHDIVYYPIDESRDIFNGLFDDIKDDNYDEWGDDFTVTYLRPDGLYSVEEMYVVENETIRVEYYNSLEIGLIRQIRERREIQGKRLTGFIALRAGIKKDTDEYRLGNYFGKDISEVLNDFDNQYYRETGSVYGDGVTHFFFDLCDKDTMEQIMRVSFYTFDNIITRIIYGYSFQ